MIRINSFSIKDNFAQRTWEFQEKNIIARTKSLTIEFEREISYEKIGVIQSRKIRDMNWLCVAFIIIGTFYIGRIALNYFGLINSTFLFIEKVGLIAGLALIIPIFRKHEEYLFLDTDRNLQMTIRVGSTEQETLQEAINLIKQKTEIISETFPDDLLPNTLPLFEIIELNFLDFMSKSTARFYDDRIIDVEKSLEEETTTEIRYDELSGKTQIIKTGNNGWECVWPYLLMFTFIANRTVTIFFSQQIMGNRLYSWVILGGLILVIPLILLKYIKKELLVFYNKNDEIIFWTRRNSANQKKLDQIVEFIQKTISIQNK
jgi:hypothetical protein